MVAITDAAITVAPRGLLYTRHVIRQNSAMQSSIAGVTECAEVSIFLTIART